ncbi:hypothetical protein SMACR_05825 [Sordaria macrospora]|uniref:WGS project CABT00000000 data, contig 2.6 n=2 Tax=Sordaria macrospora TaxID=5147 RepID=F7VTC5_SORMK|nr:uncharacterized protein SMAC_05825 [Sordaria macrospora k-hell]KAA8629686.1 hypothetical protein SMACR_05825 [Sordaria macrospora]KAH7626659.1 hypothetical protein B0T09DRAFT_46600 [Sordaria sp. MPI-SDFR-AT-0083]WPJ57794.1 hypothetical protein SMAC4_05825 [Sordaria macrospora]CCC08581.1 unnamed protein product [Sordaria macrospora k-hell]
MCIQEYIAYQCGHRTPGVVRPCPLTTAGHNFPVCTIQPSKQHLAQTMCGPCERLLHSRWVLIREWEHRWLHERGVCSCDVVFPGLLTQPRVIGTVSGDEEEEDGTEEYGSTIGRFGFAPGDTAEAEEGQQGQAGTGGTNHHIPPIFTETTVAGDQQRVAIRLPGLYAAEWLADHRALHDSGRCQCPVQSTPFQPDVGEYDMSAEEREFLQEYRQNGNRTRAINESEEEIALRMAQINDTFGPFNPAAAATAASSAPVKPTPVSDLPPPTGPRRARAASHHYQGQNHGAHHPQFRQGQVGHHHDQPRYSTLSSTLATTTVMPFSQRQSFDPAPRYYQQQFPFGLADQLVQLSISTAQGGGHSYAGPSNYNNYNHTEHVYGPNTFIPMGIIFPDDHIQNHVPETQDDQQHHQQQQPHDQHHHHHHHHQELRSLTSSLPPPSSLLPFPGLPYCGLPVGSGPEGSEVHMPAWEECPLRRCKSSLPAPGVGAEGAVPSISTNLDNAETSSTEYGITATELFGPEIKGGVEANTNTGNGNGNGIGNGDGNDYYESGCETAVGHTDTEQHQPYRTGGLGGGGGHQRSSSYS